MTVKKVIKIFVLLFMIGVALLVLILYLMLRTKSTNLNQTAPFEQWIGRTVTLQNAVVLYRKNARLNPYGSYSLRMIDSLHPSWDEVDQQLHSEDSELQKIREIPAGTNMKVQRAVQLTTGVSGLSYPTIFGRIVYHGQPYVFRYQWGEIDGDRDDQDNAWQFHQAPWQNEPDTAYYVLPTAD